MLKLHKRWILAPMPEPTEMQLTLSVDGLHLWICTVRAQHRDIMEWGCAGLKAIPQESLPWVSFQRGNPHMLFSKGHSRM